MLSVLRLRFTSGAKHGERLCVKVKCWCAQLRSSGVSACALMLELEHAKAKCKYGGDNRSLVCVCVCKHREKSCPIV